MTVSLCVFVVAFVLVGGVCVCVSVGIRIL